ncbi:MAG: SRPBCC domain-containing protein [Candidatus Eremiobacteraeota bacterium]|nr:SRPBCC domain-containing protein [Candidatus Eremiobacteraeota bacterium]
MNASTLDAVVAAELPASPERVFRALTSDEIVRWWVRAGVFDTREWTGDVRPGGMWHASGMARGNPYTLDGEYLEVDAPKKLVHTWQLNGMPLVTTVTYELQRTERGTQLTVRHAGCSSEEAREINRTGWETSIDALRRLLE